MDKDTITITLDGSGFSHDPSDIFTTGDITLDLNYNAANTINLGDYSIPYISGTSDTITIGDYDTSESFDWFKDQAILEEYREEKALREKNEGIQAAWEQYKILVELAKNPPENLDNQ